MTVRQILLPVALIVFCAAAVAQEPKPSNAQLRDEMRTPWSRSNERFIRSWLVLGDIPLAGTFERDLLAAQGGESGVKPVEKASVALPNGATVAWRQVTAWGDGVDVGNGRGLKRDMVAYAYASVTRPAAGKALLSIGSDESIRVWVNGALALDRRTRRPLTFDEDLVEVEMKAGENALLVKLEQRAGPWTFAARVLEPGTIPPRVQEIGPSLNADSPTALVVRTDVSAERASLDKVKVQAVAPGGRIVVEKSAARGESVQFDSSAWPDGAYEFRCATKRPNGLLYTAHLPWYKGDAIAGARAVVAAAASTDAGVPAGFTTRMLADMVVDRLGKDLGAVTGNPWWAIHSPLMEFAELQLEAAGKPARERPYGFYRLAWRDEVDGSPQFCRAYLPGGYDRSKKWPLVVNLHGYYGDNPVYVRWWSVDDRHLVSDNEYAGHRGVIYMQPHGRANTTYLGLGDQDVMRAIREAKERFSIDEDRIYLTGESMGGWGTWNVATRHPDLFAAIAPIFGGSDYHSTYPEAVLAKLDPLDRFFAEKTDSSWAMAEGLLNVPILVHHGDADRAANVDYSRYGVRMLQRWGYDVRYIEMPGYQHEDLNLTRDTIDWFLEHRRVANPARVRLRSAELQNAAAYWVRIERAASPREFMVVDAEVLDPGTIRIDTQNVLALSLTPPVDASHPVRVVWNGETRTVTPEGGRIALSAAGYKKETGEKNGAVAGPLSDVLNTPFAIVMGTASADPAMKEMCRLKAEAIAGFWKQWQQHPPRVFLDSEITDADAARYSLILIGGPEANRISRKFGLVDVARDHVTVRGRTFAAKGALVQAICPNPLNPRRYALTVAGSSAGMLSLWSAEQLQNAQFDFAIDDGHVASGPDRVPRRALWVAGGWFDHNWQFDDSLILPGDSGLRSSGAVMQPDAVIPPAELNAIAGSYQFPPDVIIRIRVNGNRLMVKPGQQTEFEAIATSDGQFCLPVDNIKLVFEKDAAGKVTSMKVSQNGQTFTAKKLD